MEEKSTFDKTLASIMSGFCPDCGAPIIETCTDQETNEWTITCEGCPFVFIFAGV